MRRSRVGGGFGFIVLLVVVAVVMLLASRMLRGVGGVAVDATRPKHDATVSPDLTPPPVNSGAGQRQIEARLSDAQKKTAAHTDQMKKALQEAQ